MSGRGSWTPIGGTAPVTIGGHTYGYYQLWDPQVGSQVRGKANVDPDYKDYRAVWAGTKAIQRALNREFGLAIKEDGTFGQATADGVTFAQQFYGLDGLTPGRVGPTLAKRLFRNFVISMEDKYGIPGNYLGGLLDLESGGFDPGSVGEVSDLDNGIAQFHVDGSKTWWMASAGKPEVTITHALAFDAEWAIESAAARMAFYRARYAAKGTQLQDMLSLAQHNAPGWADLWASTGTAPNATISTYVQVAMNRAASY